MWLLKTDGNLGLKYIPDLSTAPKYAVLSHTWLEDDQEILFEHVRTGIYPSECLKGREKVVNCCLQAKKDGYDFVWIDTCCINKSSSAELSEAINSMFAIYDRAGICYAHLADVDDRQNSALKRSRYFTRGWTLQELIAPSKLNFFTSNWELLGSKNDLMLDIEDITGIQSAVLVGTRRLNTVPHATIMSYAAHRDTTKAEDKAYSLMGLFDIHMPIVYGEGGEHAFIRLQHEILVRSPAHSLLAWEARTDKELNWPGLAFSPLYFANSRNVFDVSGRAFARAWRIDDDETINFQKVPRGIRAKLPVFDLLPWSRTNNVRSGISAVMVIACKTYNSTHEWQYSIGVALRRVGVGSNCYVRMFNYPLINIQSLKAMNVPWECQYVTLLDQISQYYPAHKKRILDLEIQISSNPSTIRFSSDVSNSQDWELHKLRQWSRLENWIWVKPKMKGSTVTLQFVGIAHEYAVFGLQDSGLEAHSLVLLRQGVLLSVCVRHGDDEPIPLFTLDGVQTTTNAFWCKCGLGVEATLIVRDDERVATLDVQYLNTPIQHLSTCIMECMENEPRQARWVKAVVGAIPSDALDLVHQEPKQYLARIPFSLALQWIDERPVSATIPVLVQQNGKITSCLDDTLSLYDCRNSIGYEVLVGPPDSIRWHLCTGEFSVSQLAGATPIIVGSNPDGLEYFCRPKPLTAPFFGLSVISERSKPDFCMEDYEVLVYA